MSTFQEKAIAAGKTVSKIMEAEKRVAGFIIGQEEGEATCTETRHRAATTLERLILFKMLRIEFPHQSSSLTDLDIAIRKEARRP